MLRKKGGGQRSASPINEKKGGFGAAGAEVEWVQAFSVRVWS